MKIEMLPLVAGVLMALVGLGLVFDAWLPDRTPRIERRRRVRRERSRGGEGFIGAGMIAMAAGVAGRDGWRYSILAILVGAALIVLGALANASYFRDLLSTRGTARRRAPELRDRPAPGSRSETPES